MSSPREPIFELIVVSEDAQGNPHIAPFGIRRRNHQVLIAPYRPSTSLDNLLQQGRATLNMTDDVRVFAGALTGHECWAIKRDNQAWVLDSALSYQTLKLQQVEDNELRPTLYFDVLESKTLSAFAGYNRAQNAVIELAVLVSRLHLLPIAQIKQEMQYLHNAISKTAGEREWQAWQWLAEKIAQYPESR